MRTPFVAVVSGLMLASSAQDYRLPAQGAGMRAPGHLVLTERPANDAAARNLVRDAAVDLAARINAHFVVRRNASLILMPCGKPEASHDPNANEIRVCDELAILVKRLLAKSAIVERAPTSLDVLTVDALKFALAHEFGHLLIAQYELPITGRAEIAADQFAAFFFLAVDTTVIEVIAAGSLMHQLSVGDTAGSQGSVHGEPNERAINLTCWWAGRERRLDYLNEELPATRRSGCIEEYTQAVQSWKVLTRPFYRP